MTLEILGIYLEILRDWRFMALHAQAVLCFAHADHSPPHMSDNTQSSPGGKEFRASLTSRSCEET